MTMALTQITTATGTESISNLRSFLRSGRRVIEIFEWFSCLLKRAVNTDRLPVNDRLLRDMGIEPPIAALNAYPMLSPAVDGSPGPMVLPPRATAPLL
jgi:hypothetical protein